MSTLISGYSLKKFYMIVDLLSNSNLCNAIHPRIAHALEYLSKTDFNSMSLGKYEVDGTDIFAIVNEYETKDEADCVWEAHRKYIDIHYIIRGSELIGTTLLTSQSPTKEYDEEGDYWLFETGESKQVLHAGMFAIFFPHDIHSTSHHPLQKSSVRKVVMKVLV
jgi:YhcH/YjgK/YiaL family protein